jgi:hypothetical protein
MLLVNFLKQSTSKFSGNSFTPEFLNEELQKFYFNASKTEEMKEFVDNQMAMLTIVFKNMDNKYLDIEPIQSELLFCYQNYINNLSFKNKNFEIPFLYSQILSLDQEEVKSKISTFLSKITDKNTMKILKDEVKKFFSDDIQKEIFVQAARTSNINLSLAPQNQSFKASQNEVSQLGN